MIEVLRAHERKKTTKVWGWEEEVYNGPLYCGKTLHLMPGGYTSYHRHPLRDKTVVLAEGDCLVQFEEVRVIDGYDFRMDRSHVLGVGDAVRIPRGAWHRFATADGCVLWEFGTPHGDDDVERRREGGVRMGEQV